jgi:hypothetical protein
MMMDDQGLKFLNGFKTILGSIGLVVSVVLPHVAGTVAQAAPHAISIAQGAFGLLTLLGLIHKAEKKAAQS